MRVIKVDLEKEGWAGVWRKHFELQNVCRQEGWDGLTNEGDRGVHMIGYSEIDEKEFNELKYKLFT